MNHPEEGTLRALLDAELPDAEARELRAHLGECASCDAVLRRAEETGVLASALLVAIDVPAPVERVRARLAAHRTAARSAPRRPWLFRGELAKAALLVLGFSGAVAAAVHPASPLRRLLTGDDEAAAPALAPPAEATPAAAASELREVGVRVRVGGVGARVALTGAVPGGTLEVRWVDEGAAAVYAPEGTTFTASDAEGRIDAALVAGPVRIELPLGAPRATLTVNGRLYLAKVGERIDYPGPPALVEGRSVRFQVR